MPHKLPTSFWTLLLVGLIFANVSVYKTIFAPRVLTVTVLGVGKGNATLLQTPTRKTILIDTGPDASILRALGGTLPMWRRDIDAVILTSSAAGSAGGLPSVQSRYHVSQIIRIGGADTPYGSTFELESSRIQIFAPSLFTLNYETLKPDL